VSDDLPVLIRARGISKRFGAVEVLSDVDLDLHTGEIHALLGENGAGKSTFAKILAGVHKFPDLSVAENIIMGRQGGGLLARVPWSSITSDARRYMDMLEVSIDVNTPMRGLSIANQQMVEIARALASDSRLIIMDEPTAPLTPREVDTLFTIARRLRDEGRTIVFISHRLEEVRVLCDRFTIFRDGAHIATNTTDSATDEEIIRPGAFSDVSFTLRKGEIIGLGGLVGAGRTDVARAIFGVTPAVSGSIRVAGEEVSIKQPTDAIALGLAFVPEDRAAAGIFATLSIEHNLTAAIPNKIAPGGFIRHGLERALTNQSVKELSIRLASPKQPIVELSGGNQQKVILARWLHTEPDILILDEPTRGIDIGVKAEFYDMIGELAEAGRAILLVSSELPELLSLCDRVLVMSEGRLTADIARKDATQENIMQAAVPRKGVTA